MKSQNSVYHEFSGDSAGACTRFGASGTGAADYCVAVGSSKSAPVFDGTKMKGASVADVQWHAKKQEESRLKRKTHLLVNRILVI